MNEDLVQITQVDAIELQEASTRAEYDIQIATAKKYPRSLRNVIDNSIVVATLDKETAQTCGYALPRAGKTISGASVHLARILAAEYGNLRVEAKVINITQTQVVSQAICFDLEKNYAVKVEVRKSIIGKRGRFNEDMITVTGNAANAISFRNAVFNIIPRSITDKVYQETRNMITGDLSDETKLLAKRKKVLDMFKDNLAVTEEMILKNLNINTIKQIKQDEIVTLIGLAQAIKDGDTNVEDSFGTKEEKKADKETLKMKEKLKAVMAKKTTAKKAVETPNIDDLMAKEAEKIQTEEAERQKNLFNEKK